MSISKKSALWDYLKEDPSLGSVVAKPEKKVRRKDDRRKTQRRQKYEAPLEEANQILQELGVGLDD